MAINCQQPSVTEESANCGRIALNVIRAGKSEEKKRSVFDQGEPTTRLALF